MSFGSGDILSDHLKKQREAEAAALLIQEARVTLVHNEQVKLVANGLNIVAAGFFITGVIAPLTNAGTTVTPATAINTQSLAVMGIWIVMAIALHYGARLVLRNQR